MFDVIMQCFGVLIAGSFTACFIAIGYACVKELVFSK